MALCYFYSRPCGRGDDCRARWKVFKRTISTHAPAGGATSASPAASGQNNDFYSRPCGRGDPLPRHARRRDRDFYSRPCGRGDTDEEGTEHQVLSFLLTPLREGRHALAAVAYALGNDFYSRPCGRGDKKNKNILRKCIISTHAPAGGATTAAQTSRMRQRLFLLTPLREGRRAGGMWRKSYGTIISTHAPAGGATCRRRRHEKAASISTHAPAGGATAIFHKSVMRFCGKLPKDDTVLCLASFGFPRRDPKAVYLAWISCANLPQKCVREGLALKDQGTSCFHEGLASHAFDPVLV